MHFALPNKQRQSSPFRASQRPGSPSKPINRRFLYSIYTKIRQRPLYLTVILGLCIFTWLLRSRGNEHTRARAKAPETVLVIVSDRANYTSEYTEKIVLNRKKYTDRWNYGLFQRDMSDYYDGHGPREYAKLAILRHAMTWYPYTRNFFYLSSNALIMNPSLSLEKHLLERARLNKLMMRNLDVIPPQSIIKTYKHIDARSVQLIVTQDGTAVSTESMILRRVDDEFPGFMAKGKSVFGHFLLDVWMDPLYKSYHFSKGERSAFEHIIQWHPTILSRISIIPQRTMNSYVDGKNASIIEGKIPGLEGGVYAPGDFVVSFGEACHVPERQCKEEFDKHYTASQA